MKYYIESEDLTYEFWLTKINGVDVLVASHARGGETHSVWTADWTELPKDDAEAQELLNNLDWAVEQESALNA